MGHDERFLSNVKSRRGGVAASLTASVSNDSNENGNDNGNQLILEGGSGSMSNSMTNMDAVENGLLVQRTYNNNNNNNSSLSQLPLPPPPTARDSYKERRRQRYLRTNNITGGKRRRRNSSNLNHISYIIASLQKRATLFLKRHPEKLPLLVGAVLLGGIGLCLMISAVIHYELGGIQSTTTTGGGGGGASRSSYMQRTRHHAYNDEDGEGTPWSASSHQHEKLQQRHEQERSSSRSSRRRSVRPYDDVSKSSYRFDLLFHPFYDHSSNEDVVSSQPRLGDEEIDEWQFIDYGGLDMSFFEEDNSKRQIFVDYGELNTDYRDVDVTPHDDDIDTYFAFDDDVERNEFADRKQDDHGDLQCRRVKEHRINYQNCNSVHELALLDMNVHFLGEGSYRAVVGLEHDLGTETERVAMKDILYERDKGIDVYEYSRMDAMVAERLMSSPRVFDIYGFCGLSIVSEFFEHGDIEPLAVPNQGSLTDAEKQQVKEGPLPVFNDISPSEKLRMSLQMAEGIADIHGNTGGVIVHQDVQLSQFLFNSDKSILKLNDFNRAEFMLWNEKDAEYCKYTEFVGSGSWRSPEEYFDNPLNEQVDVFSLGNNMYSLLTGLWVFYDEPHTSGIQRRIKKGETAYINPQFKERSFQEAKLVEAIEWCHKFNPDDRPTVFELVAFLRQAIEDSAKDRPGKSDVIVDRD